MRRTTLVASARWPRERRRTLADLMPGLLLSLSLPVALLAAYSLPELGVWIYR